MKKLLMCLGLCLMLVGCGNTADYERSDEMATINNTTWDKIEEKIENKETFMVMCTREECSSCEYFIENVLSDYLKTHGFEFNRVNFLLSMSDEERKPIVDFVLKNPYSEEVLSTIDDYQDGELLTPTLYFIEDGEVKDMLVGGNITEKQLDELIVKYRLDEKR